MALNLPSPFRHFLLLLALLAGISVLSIALFTFYLHLLFPFTKESLEDPYTGMYLMIGYAIIGLLSALSATVFMNVSPTFRNDERKRILSFFLLPFLSIAGYIIVSLMVDFKEGLTGFSSIAPPVFSWLLCQTAGFIMYRMLIREKLH